MTAAFRLPRRHQGLAFVFLSVLPLLVALHQLLVLLFDLIDPVPTPRYFALTTGLLVAAGLATILLRAGLRRMDR